MTPGRRGLIAQCSSVLILSSCDFGLGRYDFEGLQAEAFYDGENVVSGFGLAEGLWVGADGVEVGWDHGFQFRGRAVDAAEERR